MEEKFDDLQLNTTENSAVEEVAYDKENLEKLLEFDFSSNENFDLEGTYKDVLAFDEATKIQKISQEENLIQTLGKDYIESEFYTKIEDLRKNIKSYFKKYSASTEYVDGLLKDPIKNSEELDKLFAVAQFLIRTYKETINNLLFVIKLDKKEYNMINDIMNNKTEVTGNETLLDGMDNLISYLNEWKKIYKETPGDILTLPMDIKSIVLLYHFLSKKNVKGFSEQFYTLRTIMFTLKETNDLYSAYNTISQRLIEDFTIWSGSITPLGDAPTKEVVEE